jgi:hypothetical protein
MKGPDWGPPIDWDEPLDGETTEQMVEDLERRRIEEENENRRNRILWDNYKGYYGRNGQVVIAPKKPDVE